MRYDSRLPRVLHVLLHLEQMDKPATSVILAQMLQTNSSMVRRTMGGLREAGYVTSTRGHGGGWTLARPLADITLLDLYEALDSPELFALGEARDMPACLMERAANDAISSALEAARVIFLDRLAKTTVADLAADFEDRLDAHLADVRAQIYALEEE